MTPLDLITWAAAIFVAVTILSLAIVVVGGAIKQVRQPAKSTEEEVK